MKVPGIFVNGLLALTLLCETSKDLHAEGFSYSSLRDELVDLYPSMVRDIEAMHRLAESIRLAPDLDAHSSQRNEADQLLQGMRRQLKNPEYRKWLKQYLRRLVQNESWSGGSYQGPAAKVVPLGFAVDLLLGIDVLVEYKVEGSNYGSHTIWHYSNGSFPSTSLAEVAYHFQLLKLRRGQTFYDLGAGHGRVVLITALLFPRANVKAVEIVSERCGPLCLSAKALGLRNLEVISQDVMSVNFDDGDWFYMYYPFPHLLAEVSRRLEKIATQKPIWVSSNSGTNLGSSICVKLLSRDGWMELSPRKDVVGPAGLEPAT